LLNDPGSIKVPDQLDAFIAELASYGFEVLGEGAAVQVPEIIMPLEPAAAAGHAARIKYRSCVIGNGCAIHRWTQEGRNRRAALVDKDKVMRRPKRFETIYQAGPGSLDTTFPQRLDDEYRFTMSSRVQCVGYSDPKRQGQSARPAVIARHPDRECLE
jgi:hypothetical protein